ncbi:MAG: hypothetical protein AAGI38_18525, partial [Bacteroidota bacterium]
MEFLLLLCLLLFILIVSIALIIQWIIRKSGNKTGREKRLFLGKVLGIPTTLIIGYNLIFIPIESSISAHHQIRKLTGYGIYYPWQTFDFYEWDHDGFYDFNEYRISIKDSIY